MIALAHNYVQNGGLCTDPDMQIRIYADRHMAEALTFQQAFPPEYTEVYPGLGLVNPKAKKSLNSFLDTWLGNAIAQGHGFRLGNKWEIIILTC